MIYDARKNKMVSYLSTGFTHEAAFGIFENHNLLKNKKLEMYTEENFEHFV